MEGWVRTVIEIPVDLAEKLGQRIKDLGVLTKKDYFINLIKSDIEQDNEQSDGDE